MKKPAGEQACGAAAGISSNAAILRPAKDLHQPPQSASCRWRKRALTGDDDDVARRIARAVAQVYWLIELYGEAIAPFQAMGSATKRHLNAALLHQDLVMNADIAGTRFNRHARAGRQNYFDDL